MTPATDFRWWRGYLFAAVLPAVITLLSVASSPTGTGPFDARTGEQLVGITLAMPTWESVFEPIFAPFYVISDAGDYSGTAISVVSWAFLLCFFAQMVLQRRNQPRLASRVWRSVRFAVGACLLLFLYFFFAILVPLPGWSLKTDDPSLIVADLHSHTIGSHDAFVSSLESANLHHARGYTVFAWTEHYSSRWPSVARQQVASKTSDAIIGVEIGVKIEGLHCYLVLLGIEPDFPIDTWLRGLRDRASLRRFIDAIHSHHGAVIALSLFLKEKDVTALAEDGVDAFEIANFGHPRIGQGVRAALLSAEKTNHVSLVADSDWHGWSGFFRTWNVIVGHAAQHQPLQVVDAISMRKTDEITPVVSRMFEYSSIWETIFSAFTEAVRYARQLSPLRVLSWWVWTLGLCWLADKLKRSNHNLPSVLATSAGLVLGTAIVLRGVQLMVVGLFSAMFPYPFLLGSFALTSGIAAIFVAWTNKASMRPPSDSPFVRAVRLAS